MFRCNKITSNWLPGLRTGNQSVQQARLPGPCEDQHCIPFVQSLAACLYARLPGLGARAPREVGEGPQCPPHPPAFFFGRAFIETIQHIPEGWRICGFSIPKLTDLDGMPRRSTYRQDPCELPDLPRPAAKRTSQFQSKSSVCVRAYEGILKLLGALHEYLQSLQHVVFGGTKIGA